MTQSDSLTIAQTNTRPLVEEALVILSRPDWEARLIDDNKAEEFDTDRSFARFVDAIRADMLASFPALTSEALMVEINPVEWDNRFDFSPDRATDARESAILLAESLSRIYDIIANLWISTDRFLVRATSLDDTFAEMIRYSCAGLD